MHYVPLHNTHRALTLCTSPVCQTRLLTSTPLPGQADHYRNMDFCTRKPGHQSIKGSHMIFVFAVLRQLHLDSKSDEGAQPGQIGESGVEAQLGKCSERAKLFEVKYMQMKEAEENACARHHTALEKLTDERAYMSKAKKVLKEVEAMQKRKALQLKHAGKTIKELTDELKSQSQVVR
eukprot:6205502-Pleurochrysis_carterae.AAC.1